MPRVSLHFFAVLLFVWRKTVGFGKCRDYISRSQMVAGTGLHKDTVRAALDYWSKAGLCRRGPRCGLRGTYEWEVFPQADGERVMPRLGHAFDRSSRPAPTGRTNRPSPGGRVATQKIEGKIRENKSAPPVPLPAPAPSFAHLSDQQLERNIGRIKKALDKRGRLAAGETERLERELSGAHAELLRRKGSTPAERTA